jgi:hypothetical protein
LPVLHSTVSPVTKPIKMVRPEGLEPPTLWFEARCSIQLSYGRTLRLNATL